MTTLLLLDATNIGHRVFHGIDGRVELSERFGFALDRWRRACKPDLALAVFDGEGETWRHNLWPTYKAKRNTDPSNRPSATNWLAIKRECGAAGIKVAQSQASEADDLIGSYTAAAVSEGMDVAIVTGDKGLWQLVRDQPRVRVHDPGNGAIADVARVLDRWGVRPDQLADLLALAGDASDNYPGVPGIGPGTAAKLLRQWGSLDNLLANAALVPGKVSGRLREHAGQARLCRTLAGLVADLPLPVPLDQAGWSRP